MLGVGAAAAIIAGTAASALAAPSPSSTQSASSTESPDTVYFATGLVKPPYQIVAGGSIYSENTLEATSVPPPESCQIGVELRFSSDISQNLLESAYSGYKACPALLKKSVVTPAFKCRASPGVTKFYTTGITDLITPQGVPASDTNSTGTVSLYCES
jgi:hypothetical protein